MYLIPQSFWSFIMRLCIQRKICMEILRVINASKPLWVLALNYSVLVLLSHGGRRVVLHPSVCTASVPDTTEVSVVSEGETKAKGSYRVRCVQHGYPMISRDLWYGWTKPQCVKLPNLLIYISRSAGVESKVVLGAGLQVSNKYLELWESSHLGAELCFRVGHPLLYKHAQLCWRRVVVVFPFGRQRFWQWSF